MTGGSRHGVTRGYVGGLILATVIVAIALLVATWGAIALLGDREPVSSTAVPRWAAPVLAVVAVAARAAARWQRAVGLLRGQRSPAWGMILTASLGAYLLWCLGGILAGMSIDETWVSPFAVAFLPIWAVTSVLYWAVLARRVYTDRSTPKWPWERDEEGE